jgi:hypothetical protein
MESVHLLLTRPNEDPWSTCARSVPPRPGVAPIKATGRLPKTRGMLAGGRVSQSIASLKIPGIDFLYSGVTRSRPSARAIRSFKSRTMFAVIRAFTLL